MGRPSKLTPETQEEICRVLSGGGTLEAAAASAGVGSSTLKGWRAKGTDPDSEQVYVDFRDATEKALDRSEKWVIDKLLGCIGDDWRGWMTYLERRWPTRWARRIYKPHDDQGTSDITVVFKVPEPAPDDPGDSLAAASSTTAGKGPPPGPGREAVEKDQGGDGSGNGNGKEKK
jgi:hypothetical protein